MNCCRKLWKDESEAIRRKKTAAILHDMMTGGDYTHSAEMTNRR